MTLKEARDLLAQHVSEPHLIVHAVAVSAAMGAMADHFGADRELWEVTGYLHDIDYEKWPEEHLQHTAPLLEEAGLSPEVVRAILSHGYGLVNDVEPLTDMEKSLFTVDELTGIIHAAARMRPTGISDYEASGFMKKFKDKKFAAKCNREVIQQGCEMLGMPVKEVAALCIEGMKLHAEELGIGPKTEA